MGPRDAGKHDLIHARLTPGRAIKIAFPTDAASYTYHSFVERTQTHEILIRRPVRNGCAFDPPKQAACRVLLTGALEALEFPSHVLGATHGALPLVRLATPNSDTLIHHRRRCAPRKAVLVPVTWMVDGDETTRHTSCMTDISPGGARVISPMPLPMGTHVQLWARACDRSEPLNLQACVCHGGDDDLAERIELGLMFHRVTADLQLRLAALIESLPVNASHGGEMRS